MAVNRNMGGFISKAKQSQLCRWTKTATPGSSGQNRYTTDEYSWEVPMGGSDAGEDPIYTAKRELKEETGLTAGKLEQIMRLHPSNSITDEEGFVFVATNLEQGETDFDDDENLQVRKLSLVDAIEMVKRNEITDAISVAALLRVVTK